MSHLRQDTTEILITKLTPPSAHASIVSRGRLLAKLDAGLARKLTLISAPAGFGKTTLISEWLATGDEPVAWVSLDDGDNEPTRFWRYLISACRRFDETLGRSALIALRTSQQTTFESALTSFINELAQLPQRGILVLDDYHVINAQSVHDTIAFLLDHLPGTLHLVFLTRSEPPIPLARLRVRNELSELHADDLRFSLDEIQTFFQHTLHLPLSTEVLARFETRTEGWAAALRLVALALEGRNDVSAAEQFLATFSGEHRHVLEYLAGEVLASQSQATQDFLLRTCILHRLSASLCDALSDRNDSAALLEQLAQANLFLISLGSESARTWYRYHTLFAEAMLHFARERFGEDGLRALNDKAASWYETHGLLIDAIEASIAAHAYPRAATMIDRLLDQRNFYELHTLRRWAEQLPQQVLNDHPVLCFNHAMALLFTLDRYAPATEMLVEKPLRAAEAAWSRAQDEHGLGQVFALRSTVAMWQGEVARSIASANQALDLLPEHDVNWRSVSLLTASAQELNEGDLDAAQRMLMEARVLGEAAQNVHAASGAALTLGQIAVAQLGLDQAAQIYQDVLNEAGETETMLDDYGFALVGLGNIAYERDDLDVAEQHVVRALEVLQRRPEEFLRHGASLLRARIQHARGQMAEARETLNTLAAQSHKPLALREVLVWQMRFALEAGDLSAVQHWHSTYAQDLNDVPYVQQEREALIVARLHLAEGQPDAALALLEPWRVDEHKHGRLRSEVEMLCVEALAYAAQVNEQHAQEKLVDALTLAQPKGCKRIFLDEGERMALLLQAVVPALKKRALATYATLLLKAFVSTLPAMSSAASPLLEPLSPQEQRVLRLLVAGLSNREIAQELVVSANTIKTQVKSIYRKLNVNNREEVREVARQLNLI